MADKPQESTALDALPEIVMIGKEDVFTTSDIIATHAEVQHQSIIRLLTKYATAFASFGPLKKNYFKSTFGGRQRRTFQLNEQQASFLMTLLDNSEVVVRFKTELVRQFYTMREKLRMLEAVKVEYRELTDMLQLMGDPKPYEYMNETDMINRIAFGQTAAQFRKARGLAPNESIRPYLTVEQIAALQLMQHMDVGLILAGLGYQERKTKLQEAMQRIKDAKGLRLARDKAE